MNSVFLNQAEKLNIYKRVPSTSLYLKDEPNRGEP